MLPKSGGAIFLSRRVGSGVQTCRCDAAWARLFANKLYACRAYGALGANDLFGQQALDTTARPGSETLPEPAGEDARATGYRPFG